MDFNNNIPVEPAGIYDLNGYVAFAGQGAGRCSRCGTNYRSIADKYMHEVFGEGVVNDGRRLVAGNALGFKCGRCHAEDIVLKRRDGGGTSAEFGVCCEEGRPVGCDQCGGWFANEGILTRHQARSKGKCTKRN